MIEGTHTIKVTVSDGADEASYDWAVTVKKSGGTTPAAFDPLGLIIVVVLLVVVIGVVVGVVMMRKKKPGPPAEEQLPTEPQPAPAAPSPESTRPDYSQPQQPKKPPGEGGEDYIPEASAFKVEKLGGQEP